MPAPVILIRRCWIGEPPRADVERQVDVYRSYAPGAAPEHWGRDEMIQSTDADEVAERLVGTARDATADALNLRVHVPGIDPDVAREQIERLGLDVLPVVRAGLAVRHGR